MVELLATLLREVARLRDEGDSSERSYYHALQTFLNQYGENLKITRVRADAEKSAGKKIGFPDITVRGGDRIIGWMEVKVPDYELSHKDFTEQFAKYKDNLENIVFTNFRRWQLWQWDSKGNAVMAPEAELDLENPRPSPQQCKDLTALLDKFLLDYHPRQATTTGELATALARKTKLLSQQVQENFSSFEKLQETFKKVLIHDINNREFANIIAETLTYSLLLAMLEHLEKGDNSELTLTTVIDYLPSNIPILRDLYQLFRNTAPRNTVSRKTVSRTRNDAIRASTDAVLDELKHADLESIHKELWRHKADEDPMVNFYEPFLDKYDPEARRLRGVYYTPKPVVDFIVDSVDTLLQDKTKFNKPGGLANNTVSLLDPATGTGTFLMSAIQKVHQWVQTQYAGLGVAKEKWHEIVQTHILQNFYGFELLVAPYAIAHLKLTLELARLDDFRFEEDTEMRLQVLLANALDDPKDIPLFPGYDSIPEESQAAKQVKDSTPILAVIGNPPYANFGKANKEDKILELLDDYKKNLNEKKINLNDDYIKFIRFAQWKLENHGQGIFAMITANSFLSGVTHRRMRESLLETFDEIYIYNLHGSSRVDETPPPGVADENVFNIMTGVSINIFVKLPGSSGQPCRVYSVDAWGNRQEKFALLHNKPFNQIDWHNHEVDYLDFNGKFLSTKWGQSLGKLNFFIPQDSAELIREYGNYWSVPEIFDEQNSGIQTKRDGLTIQFDDGKLSQIIKHFDELDAELIREKYNLPADGRDWKISCAQEDLRENNPIFVDIAYRPFDVRRTIWTETTKGFIAYPRNKTMKHMFRPNLGMVATRFLSSDSFQHLFCTGKMIESAVISNRGKEMNYLFPLYLYVGDDTVVNIKGDFLDAVKKSLGADTIQPEEVFYYAYAVFHCPAYRERYVGLLKIDFPRLPLVTDKMLFDKLVTAGNRLVNLHLLGDNPFDDAAGELFADTKKWAVQFGGKPPANIAPGQVTVVQYAPTEKRVYINPRGEYFAGIDPDTYQFKVGSYQVLYKWLRDRQNAGRTLSSDDKIHYMKIAVALRQTRKVMDELAKLIPTFPID